MDIPALKEKDISVRVQSVKLSGDSAGAIMLLYKDARCDMRILDEVFGSMGWKREHNVVNGNLFCTVSVYDEKKQEWISKEDVGTESNEQKEKGQASDAFKRACTNWGIGRELYTSPFIWIELNKGEFDVDEKKKPRLKSKVKFRVKKITVSDGEITELVIADQTGKVRFEMGKAVKPDPVKQETKQAEKQPIITDDDIPIEERLITLPTGDKKALPDMSISQLRAIRSMAEFKPYVAKIDEYIKVKSGVA